MCLYNKQNKSSSTLLVVRDMRPEITRSYMAGYTWRGGSGCPEGDRFQNTHFRILVDSKQMIATKKCLLVGTLVRGDRT